MKTRKLGKSGFEVSALGQGGMGMSEFYGATDEKESIATIHRALDLGVNFLDIANMYGAGRNEELVGRAIRNRRDQVILTEVPERVCFVHLKRSPASNPAAAIHVCPRDTARRTAGTTSTIYAFWKLSS